MRRLARISPRIRHNVPSAIERRTMSADAPDSVETAGPRLHRSSSGSAPCFSAPYCCCRWPESHRRYTIVHGWLKGLPDYTSKGVPGRAGDQDLLGGREAARELYLQNRDVVPMSQIATTCRRASLPSRTSASTSTVASTPGHRCVRCSAPPAAIARVPRPSRSSTSETRSCSTSAPR